MTEGLKVEFKREYTDKIKNTVIAFANTEGGCIYIGIEDNGTVCGTDNTDALVNQVTNALRDNIHPDIFMCTTIRTREIEDKHVVCIEVEKGPKPPYYLTNKGMTSSGVFIRQGAATAAASDEKIRSLIKESEHYCYESAPCLQNNLSFDYASATFAKYKLTFGEPQKQTLGFYTADGEYTNLALLLSDQNPSLVKMAKFQGTTKEIFNNRQEFTGSLFRQMDGAYDLLIKYNFLRAEFQGLLRQDMQDYPESALREAFLNMFVHRDYDINAAAFINIYDDKTEFINMGSLPNGIDLADLQSGVSIPRNPKLANIFYRMKWIEAYGTGLSKIAAGYNTYSEKPNFPLTANVFKVILPNTNYSRQSVKDADSKYNMNVPCYPDNEKKILTYVQQNGKILRREVQNLLDIGQTSAVMLLHKMVDSNQLLCVGKGRSSKYVLP